MDVVIEDCIGIRDEEVLPRWFKSALTINARSVIITRNRTGDRAICTVTEDHSQRQDKQVSDSIGDQFPHKPMKNIRNLIRRRPTRSTRDHPSDRRLRILSRGCAIRKYLMHVLCAGADAGGQARCAVSRGTVNGGSRVTTGGPGPLINEVRTRGYLSADASNLSGRY